MPVLVRLSAALSRLVGTLPESVVQARQLERLVNVDYAMAWQVLKVATSIDPIATCAHVPRPASMRRFLVAAAKRGADKTIVDEAREAYAAFEELVKRHAGEVTRRGRKESGGAGGASAGGGRAAFDAMIAGLRGDAAPQLDLKHRRLAFRGNSYIWGVQCGTRFLTSVIHPGQRAGQQDTLNLSGWIGLHAIRPRAALALHTTPHLRHDDVAVAADGSAPNVQNRRGDSDIGNVIVLNEFCSSSAVRLEEVMVSKQARETRISLPGLGKNAEVNVVLANRYHDIMSYTSSENPEYAHTAGLRVPAEMFHMDMLIPKGLSAPKTARANMYGNLDNVFSAFDRSDETLLPMRVSISHVADVLRAPQAPGIPGYPEMVDRAIEMASCTGTVFDLYRVRVPYPVLHAMVALRVNAMPTH